MVSSKALDYSDSSAFYAHKYFLIVLHLINPCRKYLILLAFVLLNSITPSQAQLSPSSQVSILTCAPGDELYSIFGHSAIRVNDSINQIDLVFNYGTFDFDTPNFYLKFMRGHLNYMLSVAPYERFLFEYVYYKRSVWEQVLDLSEVEKNKLFQALVTNAEPENRNYPYHFFFDNCATRIRDMAAGYVIGGVEFDRFPVNPDEKMSYRQAIATYLENKPWIKLGMDLLLGQPTDAMVDAQTIQFLPDYLMLQFQQSVRISDGNQLIANTTTVLEFDNQDSNTPIQPIVWLWIAAIVISIITWLGIKQQRSTKWLDILLFSTTGVIGLLIAFLWFFTEHTVTGSNWNILWANPLHFLMIAGTSKIYKVLKPIFYITLAGITFSMIFFYLFPQHIPFAIFPIWMVLCLRLALPIIKR
jgi:hypothetical protein